MQNRIIYLMILAFLSVKASAQTEIKRVVVDTNKTVLEGAVITRLDKHDKLLQGTITDKQGIFSIAADFSAKDRLRISYLGYENQDYKTLSSLPDTIVLKEKSEELGEVVVQGKSIVTQKADRLIFNIANSNLTRGNNTFHLLRFTPLMQVDNDRISILGKSGVKLYVNGRKTLLSGEAMHEYLKSLPAESVARIEVITDPGSEYKTETNEGIVNLILKKEENVGWKGTLSVKDAQGVYNSPEAIVYLYYQKGKNTMSISAYAKKSRERYDKEGLYDYMDSGLTNQMEETTRLKHKFYGIDFNWDYQLNKNQIIGVMANVDYAKKYDNVYTNTLIQKPNTEADSLVYMPNMGDNERLQASGNVNYRLITDEKGSKLVFDLDFLRTIDDNVSFLDYSNVVNGLQQTPYLSVKQKTDNSYSTWSGTGSYNHKFSPAHQFKVGMDFYFLKGDNDFFHGELKNTEYVSDPLKSNNFEVTENYGGIYFTSVNRWNDKLSTNMGVRSEYVYRKGKQRIDEMTTTNKDFAILPSVSLNYNPNDAHSISFSVGTRKVRPYLTSLNTFRYYLSPTVYRENHPDVKSIYSFTGSLRYVLKQHYIFSALYTTKEIMSAFRRPVEGGYTRISLETFGRQHTGILGFTWNDSFFENNLFVNASCQGVWERAYGSFENMSVDVNDLSYQMFFNLTWSLPFVRSLKVGTFFRYLTAKEQADFKANDTYGWSIWGQKVFNRGISLSFGVDNLLSSKSERIYTMTNYYSVENTDFNFRHFYVQLTIPFGRKNVSGTEGHEGSSSKGKYRILSN